MTPTRHPGAGRLLSGRLSGLGGNQAASEEVREAGTRLLRECVRRSRPTAAALAVTTLLGAAAGVALPKALGAGIDAVTSGHGLTAALVALGVVLAVTAAVEAADEVVSEYYGSHLTAALRRRLISQAVTLGIPGTRSFPPGDLLSRLTVNAGTPGRFLPLLASAVSTLLLSAGAIVGLALIDWRLVVVFAIGLPVAVGVVRLFVKKASGPFVEYQQCQAAIMTRLLDAHSGARTIRASGTVEREIGRVTSPLSRLHELGRTTWLLQGRMGWRMGLLTPMMQVFVLGTGGYLLHTGAISAGDLLAAAGYASLGLGALRLVETVVAALGCQIGAGRVGEVLDTPTEVRAAEHPTPMPPGPGDLELCGVTVRAGERTVLDGLDLSVPAGTSVALVGPSGTGKSTLVSLIGRLADPDEGTVRIDGFPVTEIDPVALRRQVGYAFERPALLGETVAGTIAYARPEATREEVIAAATVAAADGFIRRLPEGYDTPVADAPFSGGECQRLGLARAVLADARVLVLDDAMSSLDTATEVQVAGALARALRGRTALMVAHRASTAARAEKVAWLHEGRIRALAPHRELWADPEYRGAFAAEGEPAGALA